MGETNYVKMKVASLLVKVLNTKKIDVTKTLYFKELPEEDKLLILKLLET